MTGCVSFSRSGFNFLKVVSVVSAFSSPYLFLSGPFQATGSRAVSLREKQSAFHPSLFV
jgi:hypothetical protein